MNIEELRRKAKEPGSNISYVGIGTKVTGGVDTGKRAIRVGVECKLPKEVVPEEEMVPRTVDGELTDVVESGKFRFLEGTVPPVDPKVCRRPIFGGLSIGHFKVTAGTLGLVLDIDGSPSLITNNHVGADCNNAEVGEPWLQPGAYDGGVCGEHEAGWLKMFVPLATSGDALSSCRIAGSLCAAANFVAEKFKRRTRLLPYTLDIMANEVDVAVGEPTVDVSYAINGLVDDARKLEIEDPDVGDVMTKSGRTTGITTGRVVAIDATLQVSLGSAVAVFEHQFITEAMCQGGDSGSATLKVYDGGRKLLLSGLLFAGSDRETAHNYFSLVAARIGLDAPVFLPR